MNGSQESESSSTNGDADSPENPVLDVKDWDPPPKTPSMCSETSTDETRVDSDTTMPKTYMSVRHRSLSCDEIIEALDEKIQNLLKREDYSTDETHEELHFIQLKTRYSSDVALDRRIVEHIVRGGIAHVYLRIWQSISSLDYLSPEHSDIFRVLQMALSIVWNCTDKSASLCESLVRGAVLHLLLSELGTPSLCGTDLDSDIARLYLVKAYLGILHNVVRLCADSRKMFRSANAVTVLSGYLNRPQGLIRTKAYLILSYIISEEENDIINATDENLAYIVGILRATLEGENHFAAEYAFWAPEIVCGLNHLAVNDSNKVKLCRLGVMPMLLQLLCEGSAEEQSLAAAGLWILSFHAENKQLMKRDQKCIDALQFAAANSTQESVCRAARGALWVIRSTSQESSVVSNKTASISSDDDAARHVMISYHWGSQKTMLIVRERLRAEGYRVWMDVDNMSGSTLEAMALAVERSAVVLVCMSQGYKDSPSCRTEAEYTYRLRKDIIPLVLQPGYVPDGWLGMFVGTRLYFDLSDPMSVDAQLTRTVREIGCRGRIEECTSPACSAGGSETGFGRSCSTMSRTVGRLVSTVSENGFRNGDVTSPKSTCSMHSYASPPLVRSAATWRQQEVSKWLSSNQLAHISPRLKEFDGSLLLQYRRMLQTAPSFFYHTLEDALSLPLVDMLRFSAALEALT